MTSPDAVVVVGAGISGAACARRLDSAGLPVVLLDRGRRAGGRIASRQADGRPVDTGASYLTASDHSFRAVVDGWRERGLARAWTDTFRTGDGERLNDERPGPMRWGAPGGLRTLVEDLLDGLDVRHDRTVRDVRRLAGGARVDGEPVRAAVLAMPDPQARQLLGDEPALARRLDREWSPALALAAGWDRRRWDVDGVFVSDSADPPVLAWVADDGRRRGDDAPVLVAHSTPELAAAHLEDPEAATAPLVAAVRRQLDIDAEPRWSWVRRWRHAQPAQPRDEPYGLLDDLVGACGDGWASKPRVEGAWLSGDALGAELAARLG